MARSVTKWIGQGHPWVWLTAGTVSISLIMVLGLLALIAVRGLTQYWPAGIEYFTYLEANGELVTAMGQRVDQESFVKRDEQTDEELSEPAWAERYLYKIGNRDVYGIDFRWFEVSAIRDAEYRTGATVIERSEWGNVYGFIEQVIEGVEPVEGVDLWVELQARLQRKQVLEGQIHVLEKDVIGEINYQMERLRLRERRLELSGVSDTEKQTEIKNERANLNRRYTELGEELGVFYNAVGRDILRVRIAGGDVIDVPFSQLVRAYRPNDMSWWAKVRHYLAKGGEFIFDDPREANTEGGIFPAIFGTVMMVMLMSVFVTPFGVIAAIYLHEYAKQGPVTRIIRIAVNNLAGVPSVVYGVFGLGFFVYFVGGNIDQIFYPEALPAPTLGTPGLLWAALTLALLTVPVVIVATEEGLSRIPRAIREGSLALGATKAETLWRTVLPMATPAVMTGMILAIARAAGEVAPLMMVGVVKLAPSLPLDGNFPYLHLERKFMHLGFHIYDVGFQSPNVEAARPLVYATALLLVVIIVILNLAAIGIRNRLREKYNAADN